MTRAPRCDKPMRRHEVEGVPMVPGDTPYCGRPAGHPGIHRSAAAIARHRASERQQRAGERDRRTGAAA